MYVYKCVYMYVCVKKTLRSLSSGKSYRRTFNVYHSHTYISLFCFVSILKCPPFYTWVCLGPKCFDLSLALRSDYRLDL